MAQKEQKFKITLKTLDPFRVGGSKDPLSGVDNPLAKVGGKICIPGASLKGAYRAKIEEFLIDSNTKAHNDNKALKPCIPSTRPSPDERRLIGRYRDGDGACSYPGRERPICPCCYLLGAAGLNGFIKTVPFLFADTSVSVLNSLTIDRATNVAKKGPLRTYDMAPVDTEFIGEMVILIEDNILGWKLGEPRPLENDTLGDAWLKERKLDTDKVIKEYVKDRLESIEWIGGYKSKGCGRVKITVEGPL